MQIQDLPLPSSAGFVNVYLGVSVAFPNGFVQMVVDWLCVQPTGENGATRAPICVELQRDASLSNKAIVLQIEGKSQQVSASESLY